jgi:hypothetical protein
MEQGNDRNEFFVYLALQGTRDWSGGATDLTVQASQTRINCASLRAEFR